MLKLSKTIKPKYKSCKGSSSLKMLFTILMLPIAILLLVGILGRAFLNTTTPEVAASKLVVNIQNARENARTGESNIESRSVDINKLAQECHGLNITTIPPIQGSSPSSKCSTNSQTIEISGQQFCYVPSNKVTFDVFSAKTSNHVVFINSSDRKIALLVDEVGKCYISELQNGKWELWRNLNKQYNSNQNSKA